LKASRRWNLKKLIILENIKSNELSLVFSKTVSKGLWCDKVWGISIFSSCTPIRGIYRKSLLKMFSSFHCLVYVFLFNLSTGVNEIYARFLSVVIKSVYGQVLKVEQRVSTGFFTTTFRERNIWTLLFRLGVFFPGFAGPYTRTLNRFVFAMFFLFDVVNGYRIYTGCKELGERSRKNPNRFVSLILLVHGMKRCVSV